MGEGVAGGVLGLSEGDVVGRSVGGAMLGTSEELPLVGPDVVGASEGVSSVGKALGVAVVGISEEGPVGDELGVADGTTSVGEAVGIGVTGVGFAVGTVYIAQQTFLLAALPPSSMHKSPFRMPSGQLPRHWTVPQHFADVEAPATQESENL